MIDWCLGLKLDSADQRTISAAFATMDKFEQSLNQSLGYIRMEPLFLDIEIKKVLSDIDPEVQIAIWASASFLKRRHHHWDTSMPMPAVVVNGHNWDYYIFFPCDNELVSLASCWSTLLADPPAFHADYDRPHDYG